MPSDFDWIFKRDPYAAERERLSGYVNRPARVRPVRVPARRFGESDRPCDAPAERLLGLGTDTRSLKLKPSKRFAAVVRNRRFRLVVRVTATDAAGNVTLTSKSVRVK
jgi:hypothetical protein